MDRLALAVGRAHASLPALSAPSLSLPRLRPPSLRALLVALALVGVGALAYLAARETSLFAVRALTVQGAPPAVQVAVRDELEPIVGTSLVATDADALERRLAALPAVRSARVDRAFPHGLAVAVAPEVPLAVVRSGPKAWVVSERGRVVRPLEGDARGPAAAIWLPAGVSLEPGSFVEDVRVVGALEALRAVPERFPLRVLSAGGHADAPVLVLSGRVQLRLGSREDLPAKLAAAEAVLRSLPAPERTMLAYLDVSVPERPVGAGKSQPASQG